MSGISTGVGLISGINTADLIDQLMELEARPVKVLQNRSTQINAQKTAWMALNSGILGIKSAIEGLASESAFQANTAASSNESVLTASAGTSATQGNYQFTVRRLAQTHQMISRGFASEDALVGAGTISVDVGGGKVNTATRLSVLNGMDGVRRGTFSITNRAGTSAEIDLSDAMTLQDVLDAINDENGLQVTAAVSADGQGITLTDISGGAGNLTVKDINGGYAAADLGIVGSVAAETLTGTDINNLSESTLLRSLNDGNGVGTYPAVNDILITRGDGVEINVNIHDMTDVGDVLDAINNHASNADGLLSAEISADGNGIVITDTSGGGAMVIADGANGSAATDLGIAGTFAGGVTSGSAVLGALNSVLLTTLNGGSGLTLGTLELQDRMGNAETIDLSSATSLHDVIELINGSATNLTASVNDSGTGLTLTDTSAGPYTHNLVVMDGGGGNFADKLGLAIDSAVTAVTGSNANRQYISTSTVLAGLNQGDGVAQGKFRITASDGGVAEINIGSSVETIGDVLRTINGQAAGIDVTAQINDTGTGIVLVDAAGGAMELKVEDLGGTTAADLGLAGEANEGEAFLDGSFRRSFTFDADDTLEDLIDRINDAGLGFSAGLVNDGTEVNPYRLIITSDSSGAAGEMVFDAGDTDLSMSTFAEGRDALMRLGSADNANSFLVSSSSNEFEDVLNGVTITAHGTSEAPVTLSIQRDTSGIVEKVSNFVEAFNSVVKNMSDLDDYDPETKERGALFGDSTLSNIRSRLMNMILSRADTTSNLKYFSQIGLKIGSGNKLQFDQETFTAALNRDPQDVIKLLTESVPEYEEDGETAVEDDYGRDVLEYSGLAVKIERLLDDMTRSYDGLIVKKTDSLDSTTDLLKDRIELLNDRLSAKRAQLERQFTAMETALASMQGQQNALGSLASMASSFSASTRSA